LLSTWYDENYTAEQKVALEAEDEGFKTAADFNSLD